MMHTIDSREHTSTCVTIETDAKVRFLFLKHGTYASLPMNEKKEEIIRFSEETFYYSAEKFFTVRDEAGLLSSVKENMFTEPALNAESHGHRYDGKKGVILESSLCKDHCFQVMVSQLGGGFDYYLKRIAMVPGHPAGGIDLLLGFCDKVTWKEDGTRIYLRKDLGTLLKTY